MEFFVYLAAWSSQDLNVSLLIPGRIGTAALAVQVVGSNWPKPHYTLLVTGVCRFQIVEIVKARPYPIAEVEQLDRLEELSNKDEFKEALGDLSEQFYKHAVQVGHLPQYSSQYPSALIQYPPAPVLFSRPLSPDAHSGSACGRSYANINCHDEWMSVWRRGHF